MTKDLWDISLPLIILHFADNFDSRVIFFGQVFLTFIQFRNSSTCLYISFSVLSFPIARINLSSNRKAELFQLYWGEHRNIFSSLFRLKSIITIVENFPSELFNPVNLISTYNFHICVEEKYLFNSQRQTDNIQMSKFSAEHTFSQENLPFPTLNLKST